MTYVHHSIDHSIDQYWSQYWSVLITVLLAVFPVRISDGGRSAAADVWGRSRPRRLCWDRRPHSSNQRQLLQPGVQLCVINNVQKYMKGSRVSDLYAVFILLWCVQSYPLYIFISVSCRLQKHKENLYFHIKNIYTHVWSVVMCQHKNTEEERFTLKV